MGDQPGGAAEAGGLDLLIQNEQTKLFANALNTAATSSFTIGVLAPLAAAVCANAAAVSLKGSSPPPRVGSRPPRFDICW